MHELISVLIPVYNSERYLRTCLESVLSQSYADFEVILVDDGSTDSSAEICESYCERDARFRLIRQANSGVAIARNAGLDQAKGEYIYFLDSDDALVPETLQHLYDALRSGDYDFAASGYRFIREGVGGEDRYVDPGCPPRVLSGKKLAAEFFLSCDTVWFVCWNKLIKRSVLGTLRFEPIAQEDYLFSLVLYSRTGSLIYLNEVLYEYYDYSGSLNKRPEIGRIYQTVNVLWRSLSYIPGDERHLRDVILRKLYQRMQTALYYLRTMSGFTDSDVRAQKEFHRRVKKGTWKEYLSSRGIPLSSKAQVFAAEIFPCLFSRYMEKTNPNFGEL